MTTTATAKITLTLEQPVTAGTGPRPDYRNPTHNHIPGAVLRGACAAEWIRRLGPPEPDTLHRARFLEVFEGDGVFGPLHKAGSLPVPISVWHHKYDPAELCPKLWWDAAHAEIPPTCPQCHQRLEQSKGKPRKEAKARELQRTRSGLDLDGVTRTGMLFRTDALADSQVFTGWVSGAAVEAFSLEGTNVDHLRLGGDRSIGGLASVQIDHAASPDLLERVTGDDRSVVLRLAAPGIFVNAAGLPAKTPEAAELADALGVAKAKVVDSWTRWGEVAGWHGASGLPKPTERCVTAGSTYLVHCKEKAPTDEALRMLRVRGLGLRRREGFGALCPPIAPPVTLASLTGLLAALRAEPDFADLVRRLRERTSLLEGPGAEDQPLLARLEQLTDRPRAALRTLLEMDDVALYRRALDYLAPGQATR
ncbi:MAG: type III-B CRISPR module-associated Cmr3 family protein [Pseudonocardiaceae bacterium]